MARLKKAVLLVDANNLVAINTHAHSGLSTKDGTPTGGIFGTLRKTRDLLLSEFCDFLFTSVVFAFDAGRPQFRYDACPEYKESAARKKSEGDVTHEAYKHQVSAVQPYLRLLGCDCVRSPGWEADDVLAYLATHKHRRSRVVIVSGDKDLLQLVDDRVWVHRPSQRETMRGDEVPATLLLRRCIEGDSSDNIKGVRGLGRMKAMEIVDADGGYTTPDALYAGYRDPKYWNERWLNAPGTRETIERNFEIMSSHVAVTMMRRDNARLKFKRGAFDKAAFYAACKRLEFSSILRDHQLFHVPFEDRAHATANDHRAKEKARRTGKGSKARKNLQRRRH